MYVVISPSSGIIYYWNGKDTTPSIEHGLLQLGELEALRGSDKIFAFAQGSSEPKANFITVSSKLAQFLIKYIHVVQALARVLARHHELILRSTLWLSAAAALIALSPSQFLYSETAQPSQLNESPDTLSASSLLAETLSQDSSSHRLNGPAGGVTPVEVMRIFPHFNDRFGMLPGHLHIPSSLLISIQIQAKALYVRQSTGSWTKIAPLKSCENEDTHLFTLGPTDLFAVVFREDNPLPKTASIATIPRSHRRPTLCHKDLGNPT